MRRCGTGRLATAIFGMVLVVGGCNSNNDGGGRPGPPSGEEGVPTNGVEPDAAGDNPAPAPIR
jgi:hypothetical protein